MAKATEAAIPEPTSDLRPESRATPRYYLSAFLDNFIPLAFVPDWTQPVLRLLPFSGLADIPFRFYVGTLPPRQLVANLVLQLIWTVFFVLIGLWLLRAATRRVVVQGG